jgi:hypothetical protein
MSEQCWRLDDTTLPILAANPVWIDWVIALGAASVVRDPDPLAAAHELLGIRMRYIGVTWPTERDAWSALIENMGGGIPRRILEVILEAASCATQTLDERM